MWWYIFFLQLNGTHFTFDSAKIEMGLNVANQTCVALSLNYLMITECKRMFYS